MFSPTRSLLVALVLSALSVACSSSSDEGADETKIAKSCSKTNCDVRTENGNDACSRCLDGCFDIDCDPSTSCHFSCDVPVTCTDDDRAKCVQQGFTVTLPSASSSELGAACKRMLSHAEECGVKVDVPSSNCDTWAKTERSDRAAAYDCFANAACDDDTSRCEPPATDFGDRLCDAMNTPCDGFCKDDVRDALNRDGAWLKDSVMNAALDCAKQQSCSDARGCFEAWATAAKL